MDHQSCLEDQLALLEATIEDNQEEMKSLVERVLVEDGLEEAVAMVVSSWGKEQRARAEQEINTRAGPYWKVLQLFKIDITLSVNSSHRVFIKKVYERFQTLFPHLGVRAVEEHDLSKFTLVELIGYTHRWVWGKESELWKEALAHHYAQNPHHPQHRIGPMEEGDLEESVVDMMACSWERREGGRDDVSAEALADVNEGYLERYLPEDRVRVRRLLKTIQQSNL